MSTSSDATTPDAATPDDRAPVGGAPSSPRSSLRIPGKVVVILMVLLGLSATAGIFGYWELRTGPFRELTEAIGRQLPGSLPKVEGGRHRGGPPMLRIAVRVAFEPNAETAETQAVVNQIVRLAQQHADLSQFEEFQLHLFQLAPERRAKQASFVYPMAEVVTGVPFPDVPDALPAAEASRT